MFNPRAYPLPPEIYRIMTTRYWDSPNTENLRNHTGAWLWYRMFENELSHEEQQQQPLCSTWQTKIFMHGNIVFDCERELLFWTLLPAKFLCPAIPIICVHEAAGSPKVFRWDVKQGLSLIHVSNWEDWLVIPFRAIGPKHMSRDYPDIYPLDTLYFLQTESSMPILKWKLMRSRNGLTREELGKLCRSSDPPLDDSGTIDVLKARLAELLTTNDSEEYKEWYLRQAVSAKDSVEWSASRMVSVRAEG